MNSQASVPVKRIADSTVRRLSAYLRFLEDFETAGLTTISSEELAERGGTTSAQVRKDLSFFGSFGKRGLGYSVPELRGRLREILGLGREWRVVIVGAGKIGAALAQYGAFASAASASSAAYDTDPTRSARDSKAFRCATSTRSSRGHREKPDIAVLAVPAAEAQRVVDRVVTAGIKAILNFAPTQLQAPPDVTVKTVNMAMELEGLSFALTNRE